MRKTRHAGMIALLTAIALLLSACTGSTQFSAENAQVVLPMPEASDQNMILGMQSQPVNREIVLHYASENSLFLSTVTREISMHPADDLIHSIVNELLSSANLNSSVEAKLLSTEYSAGIASVNLSIEAGVNRSEQDYLMLCSAIAASLLEIDSVQAVNILTGSRSDALCGLPIGVFVESSENIAAVYAQVQTEAQHFLSGNGTIARNALLYFPASCGKYMLPEVRELNFESEDYTSELIRAICAGPLMRSCSFSVIPDDMDLLASEPELYVNDAGERILDLNFNAMTPNFLAFTGIEDWQFCAAMVLTFCSFMPELDGVRICMESVPLEQVHRNGQVYFFEDSIMRRADFADIIGSSAMLYYANENNALVQMEMPLSLADSASALAILQAMAESRPDLPGISSVFPEGIGAQDILGVQLEENTAMVNLSANFYARCQSLNAQQERLLVYAMVNALAQLDHIGNVAFVVEGMQADILVHEIYLRMPLIPDPGLVQAA